MMSSKRAGVRYWLGSAIGMAAAMIFSAAVTALPPAPAVEDIHGPGSSSPTGFTRVGTYVYFAATKSVLVDHDNDGGATTAEVQRDDRELWSFWNGTYTEVPVNANTNCELGFSPCSSNPGNLIEFDGDLYFTANDGTGEHLFRLATGVAETPVKIATNAGGSSSPSFLTVFDGALYFVATDGTSGFELWKYDGVSASQVVDLNPGGGSSSPANLTVSGSSLFFAADDGRSPKLGVELWKTDGTALGTVLVKDINANNAGSSNSSPHNLTDVNGTLFFVAQDTNNNVKGGAGNELWKSDGTTGGTVLVKDIKPNGGNDNASQNGSSPSQLTNVGGVLVFTANDGTNGTELWKSDGTLAGTTMIDIRPGSQGSAPSSLTVVNGKVFFAATSPGGGGSTGTELYSYNGSTLTLVKDIVTGGGSSSPANLRSVAGILLFSANDGTNGFELWASDGTSDGTLMVADITGDPGSSNPAGMTDIGYGKVILAADTALGNEPVTVGFNAAVVNSVSQNEGNGTDTSLMTFTVRLLIPSPGSAPTVDVAYATQDGTAQDENGDGDYDSDADTLVFAEGEQSKEVDITINGDDTVEPHETFTLVLSSDSVTVGVPGTGTILNDEGVANVRFEVSTSSQVEPASPPGTNVNVKVLLSAAQESNDVSVAFSVGGTASSGPDFNVSSPVVIPAGATEANIVVTVKHDNNVEGNETVVLTITSATRDDDVSLNIVSPSVHTLTIMDEEAPPDVPTVQFSVGTSSFAENAGTRNIVVTRSGPTTDAISVTIGVTGGTATPGVDFTGPATPVVLGAGVSSVNVPITIVNDSDVEPAETVVLTLSAPVNATLGSPDVHTLTIEASDSPGDSDRRKKGGSSALSATDLLVIMALLALSLAGLGRRRGGLAR